MNVSDEVKNSIDLMVSMVVDELAEYFGMDTNDMLVEFLLSTTGKLLYDEESKLWWCGPSDIAEMYKNERSKTCWHQKK